MLSWFAKINLTFIISELNLWAADWNNFSDLKRMFNKTDAVANDRYVFDIKGNQYRLIALSSKDRL
jgi:mRNA-degrading endonuclease HigB of HigAB toxin-antitoxin module